jgi:glycosyltransferase involved in cell wall biosynthesis
MLVSIVTPVRNARRFVDEAIRSVVEQDHAEVEHVLVDGGSTDGTVDLLRAWADRAPGRVRFVSEADRGACDAWEKGRRLARGEVLGWLGADDRIEAGALRTVVAFFRANPDAHFVYGECRLIDEEGREIGRYATGDADLERMRNVANAVPAPSAFYRRALVERVGPLDASIHLCDCDWWIRAAKVARLHRIPDVLASLRIHADTVTAEGQRFVYPEEHFRISRRHGGGLWTPIARRYYRSVLERLPVARAVFAAAVRRRARRFDGVLAAGRRVAIYGAALAGARAAAECRRRGVDVVGFLDESPPPGGRFLDLPVRRPADGLPPDAEAVVIASTGRAFEMRAALRRLGCRLPVVEYPGAGV